MTNLVTVVETFAFLADAKGIMTEDERSDLRVFLAGNPTAGDVIRRAGGIRKVRGALPGRGKSGGARVIYFFHDERYPIFLLAIFAKNERSDLSDRQRNQLAKLTETLISTYEKADPDVPNQKGVRSR